MADSDLFVGSQIRINPMLHIAQEGYLANDNYLSEGSPSIGYLEAGVASMIVVLSSQALLTITAPAFTGTQVEYRVVSEFGLGSESQAIISQIKATGTQTQQIITGDETLGSEARQTIIKDVPTGTEAQQLITREIKLGTQALQNITKEDIEATQVLQIISKDVPTASEDMQIITRNTFLGSEVESVREAILGSEVRYALYNTTNLRIMYDFQSRGLDGQNWIASSAQPGDFSPYNLNNDIVEYYWRSQTGTLSAILTCDTQISQGVFLDTAALIEHNFSRGATVVMQGSNDSGFASIGVNENLTWTIRNIYYIAPTLPLTGYRYWRFVIDDPGNADGFLKVGTIVFGDSQIFSNECNTDQISFSRKQFVDQVFTEGHTNVQNDRGTKKRLGLEFRDINSGARNFRIIENIFETYGVTHKGLWIPVPRDPSRFAVFGKLEELPQQTHNYKGATDDYVDFSVTVDESL